MRWVALVVALVGVFAVLSKSGSTHDAEVATTSPSRVATMPTTTNRPTTTIAAARPAPTLSVASPPDVAPETIAPPDSDPGATVTPIAFTNDQPAPSPAIARPIVAIYGDSLTVLSEDRYHAIADGDLDTHVHAFAGASLPDHAKLILADASTRLVLALGTNDAHRAGAQPWIDFFNQLPSSKCVVWPKPYEGSTEVRNFNLQIAAILAPHLNVHVIDWNSQAQAHPEWIGPDHVHYTDEGRVAYADLLRTAAATCP